MKIKNQFNRYRTASIIILFLILLCCAPFGFVFFMLGALSGTFNVIGGFEAQFYFYSKVLFISLTIPYFILTIDLTTKKTTMRRWFMLLDFIVFLTSAILFYLNTAHFNFSNEKGYLAAIDLPFQVAIILFGIFSIFHGCFLKSYNVSKYENR